MISGEISPTGRVRDHLERRGAVANYDDPFGQVTYIRTGTGRIAAQFRRAGQDANAYMTWAVPSSAQWVVARGESISRRISNPGPGCKSAIPLGTGDLRIFDRTSGVNLVDAVDASCAVAGVWSPVEINGLHGRRTAARGERRISPPEPITS